MSKDRWDRFVCAAHCVVIVPLLLLSACDGTTVAESALLAPALVFPSDGATNLPNGMIFEWHTPDGAGTYQLQIATDNGFADAAVDTAGLRAQQLVVKELTIGTPHFWRVRAFDAEGPGDWSATWRFVPNAVAVVPTAPALTGPDNGVQGLPTNVVLDWEPALGAIAYDVQVSMEPGLDRMVADLRTHGTSQSIRHLVNGYTYYWRVRAVSALGESNWSSVRHFVCIL